MIHFKTSATHKGISIFTEEEMKEMGKETTVNNTICDGFYLGDLTLGELVKALNLDEKGAYDFAVPQHWAEVNNYRSAIWFYPKEGPERIFGRPMLVSDMLNELKSLILNRAMTRWDWGVSDD